MVKVMEKHISSYVFPFERSKALCIVGKNSGTQQTKQYNEKVFTIFTNSFFICG